MLINITIRNIYRYSLIFAILNIVFANNLNLTNYGLFITFVMINTIVIYYKTKSENSHKNNYYLFLLFFIPLLFTHTLNDALFIVVLAIVSVIDTSYYENIDYDSILKEFNISMYLNILLMFLSFITLNIKRFENSSLEYIIIELISSITLLRITRDHQVNSPYKTNKITPALIIILTILLSIKNVFTKIIYFIELLYNKIVDVIFKIFYWLFIGIGYLLEIAIKFIKNLLIGAKLSMPTSQTQNENIRNLKIHSKSLVENLSNNIVFIILLKLALTIIVLYIFYRIILNRNKNHNFKNNVIIKRERIEHALVVNKAKNRKIIIGNNALVRALYVKSVKKAVLKGIYTEISDSSLDIKNKSSKYFDISILDKIRDIYIKARYSDYKSNKEDVKLISEQVKKLK